MLPVSLAEESSQKQPVIKAVKSISFRYESSGELSSLFQDFRLMCNDAIRIAVDARPRSRFKLIELAYPRLKEYGLHTHYILSACEVAYTVFRNRKRKKIPYITKAFIKLDSQSYRLDHLLLRIPVTPRHFVFLTLKASDYHFTFIDDPRLKRGNITVTDSLVCITFTKEVSQIESLGSIGVDLNERNVTISATNGYKHRFTDLGEVAEIKERYREKRAKIGRVTRQDRRVSKQLFANYGVRERNRTVQRIHRLTKEIVHFAEENNLAIKMEKLTGIRKLYRKGNGQGNSFRARMNTWVFGETQRQMIYKAAWLGVPAYHVNPKGTSSNCPDCGSRVVPLQERKLYCLRCDKTWERDDLASKNIMACAVPQARPPKGSSEKEPRRQEDAGNPSSRWAEAKRVGPFEPTS